MSGKKFCSFLRVRDWVKNVFLFAPIVFSGELFNPSAQLLIWPAFFLFCFLSSSVYVLNDIMDIELDRQHPVKKNRALPSGKISVRHAWIIFFALAFPSLAFAFALGESFALTAVLYLLVNVAYSCLLKNVVILDVFAIAACFVIRVVAGAYVIDVPPSEWLLICSFLLALFLAFSKRRRELTLLESESASHRLVLGKYSPHLLDQMISIVTSVCIVGYILYTQSPATVAKFGTTELIYTFPFVVYGIFRYLYLVHRHDEGGRPAETLLTDRPLLITIFLWILASALIIY